MTMNRHVLLAVLCVSQAVLQSHALLLEHSHSQALDEHQVSIPKEKGVMEHWWTKLNNVAQADFQQDVFKTAMQKTPLKIVFGVLSPSHDSTERPRSEKANSMSYEKVREQHRQTWMKSPGVCALERANDTGCVFFPVFVVGSSTLKAKQKYKTGLDEAKKPMPEMAVEHDKHHDLVFLHGENENMRGGKSFAWFEYASKAYPFADYIVKIDMDTFPFLARFVTTLPEIKKESSLSLATDSSDCPHKFLGNRKGAVDHIIQHGGSLYMMSLPLASSITSSENSWWRRNRVNFDIGEDKTTSKGVRKWAGQTHKCITDLPKLNSIRKLNPSDDELNGALYVHQPWSKGR